MSYPAYAETKPSGVDWLGDVPKDWTIKRADGFLREGRNTVDPQSLDELYVFHYSIPIIEATGDGQIEETAGLQSSKLLVEGGELLVAKLNPRKSRVLITRKHQETAVCSSEFIVLKPIDADLNFVCYLYLSEGVRQFLSASVESATRSHQRVGPEVISKMWCALPSLPEQQQIAAFLDRKTAELDAVLRLKEQQLALLAEKRQALISQAVTRGIDPTAPRKPSGIPWLGDVPEQWEVKRLKFLLRGIEQGWSPPCDVSPAEEDNWGVLKVGCVNGEVFNSAEQKALPIDIEPKPEYEIKTGDVLVSRANTRQLLGSASLVQSIRAKLLLCDKLYRLDAKAEQIDSQYLVLALGTDKARLQIEREATGSSDSMQNIGQDTLKELLLALPPLPEQAAIVAYLDRETAQMDGIAQAVRTQIETVREYRQALISAAVTGKIDVRGT